LPIAMTQEQPGTLTTQILLTQVAERVLGLPR
jgi:hypothetical protein